jgi:hypothetical protein
MFSSLKRKFLGMQVTLPIAPPSESKIVQLADLIEVPASAEASDFWGRSREIISDPVNLLIERHELAGCVINGKVVLHNGIRVDFAGPYSYYGAFSNVLVINRGVHEPVEEYIFQEMLTILPQRPVMLELGAYWAHYSMWLMSVRQLARTYMVEPALESLRVGVHNFEQNKFKGTFIQAKVAPDDFRVDEFMEKYSIETLDVLHADIQGAELLMLQSAERAFGGKRINYCFISTHGQDIHKKCLEWLEQRAYRIEVSIDCETETTSYDGLIFASNPDVSPVVPGFKPLGRRDIVLASSDQLIEGVAKYSIATIASLQH